MAATPQFIAMLEDFMSDMGPVHAKRMFGGAGLYMGEVMFGLIADDVLFLKADEQNQSDFEDEGCGPFVYEGKSKPISMSYWKLPERLYDEPDEFVMWAEKAVEAARRAKAKSKPKAKPAQRKTKVAAKKTKAKK